MGLSWEFLFGELIKAMGPREFNYHSDLSYRTYFTAGGVNWVSAHGHHTSGSGGQVGLPVASVRKFVEDASWALQRMNGQQLHAALFGHWHRSFMCEWRDVSAFVAPSPKGADSFVRDRLMDWGRPGHDSYTCKDGVVTGVHRLRF